MGNLRSFGAFALSSVTLVVACSSSSSSSVSADQAESDVSAAFCNRFNSCAPLFIQVAYGDVPTCQTRFKLSVAPTLTATGTGATASQYETCAGAFPSISCDDLLERNYPTSCQTAAGTLADGAACGESAQCKDQLCRTGAGQTCGACSSLGAAGAACVQDGDCAYGLACNSLVCGAYSAAGATCDATTHPCDPALTCKNGSCATPGAAGAACAGLGQSGCDTLNGLYCNASSVCAAVTVATAGQPCGLLAGGGYGVCGGGGLCKGSSGTTPGSCEAPAADGAACDATNGPPCLAPAVCDGSVCKITDPGTCN
jgi:hypothetical protein